MLGMRPAIGDEHRHHLVAGRVGRCAGDPREIRRRRERIVQMDATGEVAQAKAARFPVIRMGLLQRADVRVTRRASCSQVMSRPWRSRVLPLAQFDGLRKVLTTPVSSSHLMIRSLGMSLHKR
jgi:hypothetical protein